MSRLFHYLSPKIYPIFPDATGTLVFGVFPQHALDTRAETPLTGTMTVRCTAWCEGERIWEDEREIAVLDGVCERDTFWYRLAAPGPGFVEATVTCSEPVFFKVYREAGYALIVAPDGRRLTVNPDSKYANEFIVAQYRSWQRFCMLHTACLVDEARDLGNSMLLINPYDQSIVVRLAASTGRAGRCVVPSRHVRLFDLDALLQRGRVGTVMLTANNRIVAYDLRHPYGAPERPTNIDHLDVYSGIETHLPGGLGALAKDVLRRSVRRLGWRYT